MRLSLLIALLTGCLDLPHPPSSREDTAPPTDTGSPVDTGTDADVDTDPAAPVQPQSGDSQLACAPDWFLDDGGVVECVDNPLIVDAVSPAPATRSYIRVPVMCHPERDATTGLPRRLDLPAEATIKQHMGSHVLVEDNTGLHVFPLEGDWAYPLVGAMDAKFSPLCTTLLFQDHNLNVLVKADAVWVVFESVQAKLFDVGDTEWVEDDDGGHIEVVALLGEREEGVIPWDGMRPKVWVADITSESVLGGGRSCQYTSEPTIGPCDNGGWGCDACRATTPICEHATLGPDGLVNGLCSWSKVTEYASTGPLRLWQFETDAGGDGRIEPETFVGTPVSEVGLSFTEVLTAHSGAVLAIRDNTVEERRELWLQKDGLDTLVWASQTDPYLVASGISTSSDARYATFITNTSASEPPAHIIDTTTLETLNLAHPTQGTSCYGAMLSPSGATIVLDCYGSQDIWVIDNPLYIPESL